MIKSCKLELFMLLNAISIELKKVPKLQNVHNGALLQKWLISRRTRWIPDIADFQVLHFHV